MTWARMQRKVCGCLFSVNVMVIIEVANLRMTFFPKHEVRIIPTPWLMMVEEPIVPQCR